MINTLSFIIKWIIILYLLLMVWIFFWAPKKDTGKTSITQKIIGVLIAALILTYNIPYSRETYTDNATIIKTEYVPKKVTHTSRKGHSRRRVRGPYYYTVIEYNKVKTKIDNKELYDKCKYDTGQIKRFKISERHYLIWGSKYSFKIIN